MKFIKPTNITPLNYSYQFLFKCNDCDNKIVLTLFTDEGKRRRYINLDSEEDMTLIKDIEKDIECFKCKERLDNGPKKFCQECLNRYMPEPIKVEMNFVKGENFPDRYICPECGYEELIYKK